MSVTSVLERELAAVECELTDLLMLTLPVCAKNGTLLFYNSESLPDGIGSTRCHLSRINCMNWRQDV